MLRLNLFFFIFLLSFSFAQSGTAQSGSYIQLNDPSGFQYTSSEIAELEVAADSLVATFPLAYRDSFKVVEGAIYPLMAYTDEGVEESWVKLKETAVVNSKYHLLLVREYGQDGVLKWRVDVKLPDINGNNCFSDLKNEVAAFFQASIFRKNNSSGGLNQSFSHGIKESLLELRSYIGASIVCCNSGGNIDQCIRCSSPENIAAKLLADGFIQADIKDISPYTETDPLPIEIIDHANLKFTVNNLFEIDIPSSYIDQIPVFSAKGLSIKIYITKDENACSPLWDSIKNDIDTSSADIIFWHHIHVGHAGTGDEKLFSKIFLKGIDNSPLSGDNIIELRGPDPVTAIIGALGSAFSDYMIQGISIYYLDDSVKKGEWSKAFEKVNYGSVAWSGFTGLFIVSSKSVTLALAVGAATAEVTYNAFAIPNYSMEQAGLDFARVFISDLIGNAVGGAIGSKLKNANLSWFSADALDKISETLIKQNDNITKRLYIKFAWKLEVEGLTSHSARGIDFENKLFNWLFKNQGFKQTAHNFKGIDFHRASDNLGLSLKTTILTKKSDLKKLIEQNVTDLRQMQLDRKIEFQGKSYKINKTKLLLLVPEENVATVNAIIQQLKGELDAGNLIETFEVKSFENILGI